MLNNAIKAVNAVVDPNAPTQIWMPSNPCTPIRIPPRSNATDELPFYCLAQNLVSDSDSDSEESDCMEDFNAPMSGRYRVWHLRFNNMSAHECDVLFNVLTPLCRSIALGVEEEGKVRGTKHQHCHAHFKSQVTRSYIISLLAPLVTVRSYFAKEWYIAPAVMYRDKSKTGLDNRLYCIKNGIYREYDEAPAAPALIKPAVKRPNVSADDDAPPLETVSADDVSMEILNALEFPLTYDKVALVQSVEKRLRHEYARQITGFPPKSAALALYEAVHCRFGHLAGLALIPEIYYQTTGNNVRKLNVANLPLDFPASDEQEIIWITGPAGTGKTSFCDALYPGHYSKNKDTQYWESYNFLDHSTNNPHMCVVFNELDLVSDLQSFSANGTSFDAIKNIFDVRPFPIEIKHKNQELIRPRRIFVTSNTSLSHLMNICGYQARHDTANNKLFGLDVDTLHAALGRRVKEVDIDDLLKTYRLYCFPKHNNLPFGGVFPLEYKFLIKDELVKVVIECGDDVARRYMAVSDLRKKWEKKTQEYLKQFKWINYELVKEINTNSSVPFMHIVNSLEYPLFNSSHLC